MEVKLEDPSSCSLRKGPMFFSLSVALHLKFLIQAGYQLPFSHYNVNFLSPSITFFFPLVCKVCTMQCGPEQSLEQTKGSECPAVSCVWRGEADCVTR